MKKSPPVKKAVAKKAGSRPATRLTEYLPKGTNQQKIIFVLGEAKRFLHIAEIAGMIKKHEPAVDSCGPQGAFK